jgi:hypothetical protein
MTTHELKTWPLYFRAVANGSKPFEVRKDDRGFAVGDVLWLREWDPATQEYTGDECRAEVTYVLRDYAPAIGEGYAVLGVEKIQPPKERW